MEVFSIRGDGKATVGQVLLRKEHETKLTRYIAPLARQIARATGYLDRCCQDAWRHPHNEAETVELKDILVLKQSFANPTRGVVRLRLPANVDSRTFR